VAEDFEFGDRRAFGDEIKFALEHSPFRMIELYSPFCPLIRSFSRTCVVVTSSNSD